MNIGWSIQGQMSKVVAFTDDAIKIFTSCYSCILTQNHV